MIITLISKNLIKLILIVVKELNQPKEQYLKLS